MPSVSSNATWRVIAREVGGKISTADRTPELEKTLDQIMSRSWVISYRGLVFSPVSSFLAFHPVRMAGRALHIPLLACDLMNADFDGDQMAVFLPITTAGQREAEERLSIRAVVGRKPELISSLDPRMDAVAGLASLSMKPEGRTEIENIAGTKIEQTADLLTRGAIINALRDMLAREGVEAALDASERLMQRGFEEARTLGLSMNPFIGSSLELPTPPDEDDPDQ